MIKKLPKSQIEFKTEVSWPEWEKYLSAASEEMSKEIKFPGFRPGKAPRKMVEKKIGKEKILNEAAQKAIRKSYVDFILKKKIQAVGSPEIKMEKAEEGKALEYQARVAVLPEIEIAEGYKKDISNVNKNHRDKKGGISTDDLSLEIEKLANSRAKLVTVSREAKKDDRVEIDFSVLVGGVPIENGTSKNHPVIIGKEVFIPGFEDNLAGMKEGEEKEFELAFPEDYHKDDLRGRKAKFKVRMNLVQERQIPEIDDEFAKSLGKFENLEMLRSSIREGMEHEQAHKAEEQKRSEYVDKIVENAKMEIPEILAKEELHKMFHEFEHQVRSMGMEPEQYLGKLGKSKEELEKDWEPNAIKRVKAALVLGRIAKEEKISVSSQEIENEINKTLQYYNNAGDTSKNIDMQRLYNYTKGVLENEKVFKYLEKL